MKGKKNLLEQLNDLPHFTKSTGEVREAIREEIERRAEQRKQAA